MNRSFEWDPGKAERNARKHGVGFEEGATVLLDPLTKVRPDPAHSVGEERFRAIGWSVHDRLLVVAFAYRGDAIRIISARPATRAERRAHER